MRDEVRGVQFRLLFGVLLVSGGLVVGQNECEESELGYSCKKQMTDYFALHWSLGPTTAGAEAAAGEIAMAMVGETEGWVGFAFAEVAGAMAPADFIIGWVDPDDGPFVTAYRSEIQFISNADEHDSLDLTDTEGSEEDGTTTIRFVRSLSDGLTEVVVDDEIPVNVAVGPLDALQIHNLREPTTVMLMLASESSTSDRESPVTETPAAAPTTEVQTSEPPAVETVATAPTSETQTSGPTSEEQLDCASSDLGYSCSLVLSEQMTMHWTLGPAEETDSVPELGDEDIAVAVVGQTTGWVGIVFPEQPGLMVPSQGVIGWVTDSGEASVGAYELISRSVEGVARSENQDAIRDTSCSEEDGVTTVTFVYDLSTLPGDFDPAATHVNWAVRNDDDFMIHTVREGTTVNLLGASSPATAETPSTSPVASDPSDQAAGVRETTPVSSEGCGDSSLGYSCSAQYGPVTFHWTVGPGEVNGDAPAVDAGEVAIALVAGTTGWIGIGVADNSGRMAPADVVLGWVSGGTATITGYRISGQSISPDEATDDIGLRATQGSEVDGQTIIQFVLTGELTNDVNFEETVNLNFAVGDADSLVFHSYRSGQTINLLSGSSSQVSRDLTYHRTHGVMMIIAWIGLAPFGVLVARNKYAFAGISDGAWFQIHRACQISALIFMFIGMVIALSEFDDPGTTEGKRHRKVGIAILTIGFFQGAVPFLRPHHDSPYRFFFNFFHGYLGRGSAILGIATVFLGIQAYDLINQAHVSNYWVTCVVILGVYFALAVIGEVIIAYKRHDQHGAKHQPTQQQVEMTT